MRKGFTVKKFLTKLTAAVLAGAAAFSAMAVPVAADWVQVSGKWRYTAQNGGYIRGRFQQIDGSWYMFDQNGNMVTGWYNLPGTHKWYYLKKDGRAVLNDWVFDKGWYYIGGDGMMVTGWRQIDGIWYYFLSGRMSVGWTKVLEKGESHWYYFNSDGSMRTGQWVTDKGKRYYLDKDGRMLSDCTATIDGVSYSFQADGSVVEPGSVPTGASGEVYDAMSAAVLNRHKDASSLMPMSMELDGSTLADAFGIDTDQLVSAKGEMAMMMTNCDMMLVVEAKSGKVSAVKSQLEKALQSRIEQFEWYAVMGNSERCSAAKVVSRGNFVALVMVGLANEKDQYDCSGDVAAAVRAFNETSKKS